MAAPAPEHMRMFAVVKHEGVHSIYEYTSITGLAPDDALHTYVEREQAAAKVAELEKRK